MDRLPRPTHIDSDMWVDEAIWGHRLYDEQTPWLTFLEFINVAQSEYEAGRIFTETQPNSLSYAAYSRLYLRNILFNNPRLAMILNEYPDDSTQWNKWSELIAHESAGLYATPDFSYLRTRFPSFSDFVSIVELLRSSAIEGNSNKRWSSKFVFPYGPDCLYEDLRVSGNKVSVDRRFFGRTGELLYLMISRSGKGQEILSYLEPLLFSGSSRWNRLVSRLQPSQEVRGQSRSGSYLPFRHLPEYENLADDWINLFKCQIPGYDVLPHLVNITGLHLLIYFLNRAKLVLGNSENTKFVLEIVSYKKNAVRDLSAESYRENNDLPRQAILEYIRSVTNTRDWHEAIESLDPVGLAMNVMRKIFCWPDDDDNLGSVANPNILIDKLSAKAVARNKQHIYKIHGAWGKEIGLSSRRGSRRTRYALSDQLLKTLVLCTVPKRLEFQDFLQRLYAKYGFIIGDHQASKFISRGDADQEAFSENAIRLEQRLSSIGLLKRLSDACAYVENPYTSEEIV